MNKLNLNFFKTLSLSELCLWLIIPLASLSSRTWLPVPPTLILLLIVIGYGLCRFIQHSKDGQADGSSSRFPLHDDNKQINWVQNILIVFALYIIISQYYLGMPFTRFMGVVFSSMYCICILALYKNVSTDYLNKLGQKFIRYSLVIFSVEAVLRYGYNAWLILQNENSRSGFYQFKFDGPMYVASNMLAGHILAVLFFILWWSYTYRQSMKKEFIFAIILLALTLSRASIPAVIIGLFYYQFCRHLTWKKALSVFMLIGFFGILGLFVLQSVIDDASFQSKFLIFNEAFEYLKNGNLKQLFFGMGLSETQYIEKMTHSAHNYFLLYLMETGIVGLALLLTMFFVFIKSTNGIALIVLVPYSVQISAESATFIPYFYVIMALMIISTNAKTIQTTSQKQNIDDPKKNTLLLD